MVTKKLALFWAIMLIGLACGQASQATESIGEGPAIQATAATSASSAGLASGNPGPIQIGTEYIIIEIPFRVRPLAQMLAPLGLTAAKPLPENFAWGKMQSAPDAPIDFTRLDTFVKEFQAIGADDLVLALRALSNWASKDVRVQGSLFSLKGGIKDEYLDEYANWVSAVVERYDADGVDDMPGLLNPVKYYEIGVEFSSYESEPVEEYLNILEIAYGVAHDAYPDVLIAHVAFLTTPALYTPLQSNQYEAAFAQLQDKTHNLEDMRAILDRPDIFDVLNIHSLGHPYEIETIVGWLKYETGQRGYTKPIIISDTGSTPFIAWGPATICDKPTNQMGRLVPPAAESDRCPLADYFTKLVQADTETLAWTQDFIAQDTVKRVVISAEQDIALIDTAFTEDLLLLKLGVAQAGAGTAAWAGLIDFDQKEYRPVFYALQQLIRNLDEYDQISRVPFEDSGTRVYEIKRGNEHFWIAWYDPGAMILPGDIAPSADASWDVGAASVRVEGLAQDSAGSEFESIQTSAGQLDLLLSFTPVYIFPQ